MIIPTALPLKGGGVAVNSDAPALTRQLPEPPHLDEALQTGPFRRMKVYLPGLNTILKVLIAAHAMDDQGEPQRLGRAFLGPDNVEPSGKIAVEHEAVRLADSRIWLIQTRLTQALECLWNRNDHTR